MQTAFANAFERAGMDTSAARLAAAATNILQRTDGNFSRALAQLAEIIDSDRELRHALVMSYLQDRADDMRGDGLRGGGLGSAGTRFGTAAPTRLNEGDAGQLVPSKPKMSVLALPSKNTDDEGPTKDAKLATTCLPSSSVQDRRSEGRATPEAQVTIALASSKPNPPRGLSSIASIQGAIARSILDDFKVRDGRAIGDLHWHELVKMARTNEAEARVLRYVEGHVANARPEAKVRDIVKVEVVAAAIAHAEAVNVAA